MPAALSAESWEIVFQQTLAFAEYQVARLRWRHQFHGLLPGGFDPNSIAAQAIMDFLRSPVPPEVCPPPRSGARAGLDPILWQVKRLVLKHVTRLHHLKENWLVSSEADFARVHDQDGELVSPLDLLPAPDVQPDEALIRKESLIEYHQLKFRFEVFLAKERQLITLFELNCEGISKPQTLAAHLKLGVRIIESLQKRLRREWLVFSHLRPPANWRSSSKIRTGILH